MTTRQAKKSDVQSYALNLKGTDALFGPKKDTSCIPIGSISARSDQPRCYFDQEKLEKLATSIRQHGVLEPILLRAVGVDHYEIIAGERRWRAAKLADLKTVPARILEIEENQVTEIALIENLQREDLNPLEETEAVLDLLTLRLHCKRNHITRLLNLASRKGAASTEATEHVDWATILEVLETVGTSHHSFRTNRLPLLKLPKEIKDAMIAGDLAYTKAKEIAKVEDESLRQQLVKKSINENLSLREIKSQVKVLKDKENKSKDKGDSEIVNLKSTVKTAYTRITQAPRFSKDPELKEKVDKLFNTFILSLDQLIEQPDAERFYE